MALEYSMLYSNMYMYIYLHCTCTNVQKHVLLAMLDNDSFRYNVSSQDITQSNRHNIHC